MSGPEKIEWRHFHFNFVVRANHAACSNHGHNTGLADHFVIIASVQHNREQARSEALDLSTWVPQFGDYHLHARTNSKQSMPWQSQQIDAGSLHILAKISRPDPKPFRFQLIEQLGRDQVNLSWIWLAWINGNPRTMFDRNTLMRAPLTPRPVITSTSETYCFENR